MPISLSLPRAVELKPRIVVIGVGGAGGNAVNNMIDAGLDGVEFVVANTDAQALALSKADRRIQMGTDITQGLGAGMQPEVGEASAEDSLTEILEHLDGTHMLFVAAGMGGGTGTGAAPVIARAARERGILTVAIVTKPFNFEGTRRMGLADDGLERLASSVDTLIVIPNQNLFRVATESTTIASAFGMADEVLHSGVRSVTDLMVVPGLINLDFADVRTVMNEMGKAMMGTGEATGERRAIEAAESAISNPLLDDVSLRGAKGVLINITGGKDLTLYEVDEAASLIRGQVDPDANIIVGSSLDDALDGIVRVSVVATGVDDESIVIEERPAAAPVAGYAGHAVQPQSYKSESEAEYFHEDDEDDAAFAQYESDNYDDEEAYTAPAAEPAPRQAAPRTYPPKIRAERPAPPAAPAQKLPEPMEPRRVIKNTWGIFGRKKDIPVAPQTPVRSAPANSGDLFGDDMEDELEIPSFLRRQNR